MYQMNKTAIDQWLKGVGIFLLIFIDVNYLLTTRFGRLKGNERYEAMWYLFIFISIVVDLDSNLPLMLLLLLLLQLPQQLPSLLL